MEVNDIRVYYKKLHSKAIVPTYAKPGDAACDLYAVENVQIPVRGIRLIHCGFAMEMPEGFEAQIRPRSGLAVKYGITVLNSPGTVDWGYRGEIMVPLINHGDKPFVIKPGDRIAQMKFAPVYRGHFLDVGENELSLTNRGQGGMGHTGR